MKENILPRKIKQTYSINFEEISKKLSANFQERNVYNFIVINNKRDCTNDAIIGKLNSEIIFYE